MITPDPMVLVGRRCFSDAQAMLGTKSPGLPLANLVTTGWYDTAVSPETGSFAVIDFSGVLGGNVGRVLRVSAGSYSVFVYVIAATATGSPLSLYRRAFMALGPLSAGTLECVVEIVP